MAFIVASTSLPVDRPNADRLERRTLVPKLLVRKFFWSEKIFESKKMLCLKKILGPKKFWV